MIPPTQKYPPPRTIAVDVDGTLVVQGRLNGQQVDWCRQRRADGYSVFLWSSRGADHARRVAESFGVTEVFDLILSKPGLIVDDQGWGWTRFTRWVRSFE